MTRPPSGRAFRTERYGEAEAMGEMPRNWEEELLARGIARGELNFYPKWVPKVLEKRFGTLPEDVLQRIANADLAALAAVCDRVYTIQSLDELGL
jgi:hypothetical protein